MDSNEVPIHRRKRPGGDLPDSWYLASSMEELAELSKLEVGIYPICGGKLNWYDKPDITENLQATGFVGHIADWLQEIVTMSPLLWCSIVRAIREPSYRAVREPLQCCQRATGELTEEHLECILNAARTFSGRPQDLITITPDNICPPEAWESPTMAEFVYIF